MKKLIISIAGIFIIVGGALFFRMNTRKITSMNEAISHIKEVKPELRNFPSDNLPPTRIETKEVENGWLLGFYTEGSGLPGILKAECYLVKNSGDITATGKFSAGGKAGPNNLDMTTCKEADAVSEEVLSYFTDSLIAKTKSSVAHYEKLGFGGGVDGFTLLTLYSNLKPADFMHVSGYQGDYSVENGKLTFTGNAASNSAVLMKEGMIVLLNNLSERLHVRAAQKSDIDTILSKMSTNEPLPAHMNELVSSLGIYITPLQIIEDSRCPANANCIQAGTLKINALLESPSGKSNQTFELNKTVTTETKEVTLVQVEPQAHTGVKIKDTDYIFYFKITNR